MDKIEKKDKIQITRSGEFSYTICLRRDFSQLAASVAACRPQGGKICIVTDTHVRPLYMEEVRRELEQAFQTVTCFTMEAGEEHKQLSTVQGLYAHLIDHGFERRDLLLALGGGVVGDLTGFAAATYLRGIDFIQVPTTLLSQVDSSIGGKTGVDLENYKNMVGAFHQPRLVYMDLHTLDTLDEAQFACGMAEILKHGLLRDAAYYQWLEENQGRIRARDMDTLQEMIFRSCQIKAAVVEQDPMEKGPRALLNLGHTIGHAIEKKMDFQMLHGQCVALGCVAAAYLSCRRGLISAADLERVQKMNGIYQLPVRLEGDLSTEEILAATKKDKKMSKGQIRFILLRQIGEAVVDTSVTEEELCQAIDHLKGMSVSYEG